MKSKAVSVYHAHQFARFSGITVRALHHYDRLGLLKPQRSAAGYRLYRDSDLTRLEQIAVLKFLGLSLGQIRELLKDTSTVRETLARQEKVLFEKRNQLDRAIQSIQDARKTLGLRREQDCESFKQILREIKMQNDTDWMKKYYSKQALAKLERRKKLWSPELQEQVSKDWAALFKDIQASLDEDPASPKAQALAVRWRKLIHGFTGGDAEIQKGLNAKYADQENWPADMKKYQIRPEIQDFMMRALKASQGE